MNSFLSFILAEINISNFTQNPIRNLFDPYIVSIGGWFYGLFFGMLAAIIYTNAGDKKVPATAVFLILVGTIGQVIFPFHIGSFFGLLGAFLFAVVLYKGFIVKRQEF